MLSITSPPRLTLRQTNQGNNGATAANSVTVNWPAATLPGSLLIAISGFQGTTVTYTTPSSWTAGPAPFANSFGVVGFYFPNNPGGRTSETLALAAAATKNMPMVIAEFTGPITNSPLDQSTSNSNVANQTTSDSGTTAATLNTSELIVACLGHGNSASTFTLPASNSFLTAGSEVASANATASNNAGIVLVYKFAEPTSGATFNTTASVGATARPIAGLIMTFQKSTGGSLPAPTAARYRSSFY